MPTTNKYLPLTPVDRCHVVHCEGQVCVRYERLTKRPDNGDDRFELISQTTMSTEQAVGLAMALLEGTPFKVAKSDGL